MPVDQQREHGIFDPNSYKKDKLLHMCKKFIRKYDFERLHEKIQKIKKKLFLPPYTSSKFTGFY